MTHTHQAIVELHYHHSGSPGTSVYEYPVTSLSDLTQGFLKRFGNEHFSNKLERQRRDVKRYTWEAESVYDWVTNVGRYTDFTITIIYRDYDASYFDAKVIRWPASESNTDIPYSEFRNYRNQNLVA